MKRSKMLDIIDTTLLRICGCDPDTGDLLWPPNSYIAYCVLKDMEQAGMRPPTWLENIDDELLGSIQIGRGEWESE